MGTPLIAAVQPVVSVCIANYNGMTVIDACIQSVLQQDCDFPIEIIVHDDASTDGSPDHIRRHYADVLLIESQENVGFCISNNRMAQRARGDYLLLLNNDAELFPDALRCLHEAAQELGRPAILGLPQYDAERGGLIDRGSLFDPFLNPIPNLDTQRIDVGMVIGACLWIPRSLWHDLGGFPEWFHTLAEDMYLCCAARLQGYPVRVLAASGFRHWVGLSLGGGKLTNAKRLYTSRKRRTLSERNKSYVMAMMYPALVLYFLLPLHLLFLVMEGVLLCLIKRDWTLFKDVYGGCILSLWGQRDRLCKSRKKLQAQRNTNWLKFSEVFTARPYKLLMLLRYGLPRIH